jgi:hypothetical protein
LPELVRVPRIDSDALDGASYDPEHRVLTGQFESGSVYEYSAYVPSSTWSRWGERDGRSPVAPSSARL